MEKWEELTTPCYIIDKQRLEKNTKDLQNGYRKSWGGTVRYGYSVKTNSLPWLITFMKAQGSFGTGISPCKAAGISDRRNHPKRSGKIRGIINRSTKRWCYCEY